MKKKYLGNFTTDPRDWDDFWKSVDTTIVKPIRRELKKRITRKRGRK